MIKIHFYKGKGLISRLISSKTSSPYTHTSIEVNGHIYEAKNFIGVVKNKHHTSKYDYDTITIPFDDIQAGVLFLDSQVGKHYDFAGIIGILSLKFWQDKEKWFCSELVFEFLKTIGFIGNINNEGITPGSLYFGLQMKLD